MREKSCGTVLFKVVDGTVNYLIIRSVKSGFCGLPKGHVENGESEQQTAYRETWEETSIRPEFINGFREEIEYRLKNGNDKTVVFFLSDYCGQTPAHNDGFENLEYIDMTFDQAYAALSLNKMKTILKLADNFVRKNVLNKI